ncbi:GrpB family protein [Macrococcus equipercicus]|uniref:GrpB family protein n=1 Tax=Macrococcus equipercicus TaxID=69967 RepID=A0ABQ6R848_9STAP|nr:GrpB family protein [Macrococcus equipercicus]KAA1039283.1 GrpB family protein [Macrococcus equipercicus]
MRRVIVEPYDSIWQHLYIEEARKLRDVFKDQLVAIHHIGSTAVPGLAAKPVIDIMPVVKDLASVDDLTDCLTALGYTVHGENGIPGRRYFQKGGDNRTHHVHVYQKGDANIVRHLAFRDYLRTFRGEMERYQALKFELAQRYPFDIASYIEGKNIFVLVMEQKALSWYNNHSLLPKELIS